MGIDMLLVIILICVFPLFFLGYALHRIILLDDQEWLSIIGRCLLVVSVWTLSLTAMLNLVGVDYLFGYDTAQEREQHTLLGKMIISICLAGCGLIGWRLCLWIVRRRKFAAAGQPNKMLKPTANQDEL